nr:MULTISPECIES: DUF624 domain-containing protein [Microbacterium]
MVWLRVVSALIVVNLLFAAGVIAGLVVLGTLPALAATTASLTRLRDGDSTGIVRSFVAEYRRSFWRANLLGVPFAAALLVAVADLAVLPHLPAQFGAALLVVSWVVLAYAAVALVAGLVIEARYRDGIRATRRYAVSLPLVSPAMTVALVVTLGVVAFALSVLPMLVPLIGVSVPLYVAGWFVDHRLAQLDPEHPHALQRPPVVSPAH